MSVGPPCPKCETGELVIGQVMATGVDVETCTECDYEKPLTYVKDVTMEAFGTIDEISIAGVRIKPMPGMLGQANGSITRYFEIEGKKVSASSARRLANVLLALTEEE